MSRTPRALASPRFESETFVGARPDGATGPVFRLTELVAMQTAVKPDQPFLETFQGPGATMEPLTFRQSESAILRLAGLFLDLDLARGDTVALVMPNVAEASLALVAILQADLRPLLVPAYLPYDDMLALIQASQAKAIVTTGAVRALALPECLAHVAAAAVQVRFVMAFGPVEIPGILALDRLLADAAPPSWPAAAPRADNLSETILLGGSGGRLARRSVSCLVSSALQLIAEARIGPNATIATALAPDDGAALASGVIAALLIGTRLSHIPADGVTTFLRRPLGDDAVLVWPGQLEAALENDGAAAIAPWASIVLVHQAPFERMRGAGPRATNLTDLWAFEDKAISIAPRGGDGIACLAPAGPGGLDTPCEVKAAEDGRLYVRGESVEPAHAGPDGWCELDLRLFCDWEQDVLAIEPAMETQA